jgi:hypothetical protein
MRLRIIYKRALSRTNSVAESTVFFTGMIGTQSTREVDRERRPCLPAYLSIFPPVSTTQQYLRRNFRARRQTRPQR